MKAHFTPQDHTNLYKEALFPCPNKEPRDALIFQRPRACHSSDNPVARIKAIKEEDGRLVTNNKHYDEDSILACIPLCRNAKVSITGNNICPQIGLFNGSIGTVLDIVYKENESPNNFALPSYVLVEFTFYRGKPFLSNKPKAVPFVPTTAQSKRATLFLLQNICTSQACFW